MDFAVSSWAKTPRLPSMISKFVLFPCPVRLSRGHSPYVGEHMVSLLEKITAKSVVVGVIGQGYVGLPLALVFWEAGFKVIGFDVDTKKIEALSKGESYIKHVGPQRVTAAIHSGGLCATSDFDRLRECDAILICVPPPREASRARQLVHSHHRAGYRATPAAPAAGGARIHNLPRRDGRGGLAHPRRERAQVAGGLLPGLLARAGRSRKPEFLDANHSQGRRWHQCRIDRGGSHLLPCRLGECCA